MITADARGDSARIDLEHGACVVDRPAGLSPDAPAPLVFCLHGTSARADEIAAFWRSIGGALPFVIVAPQAGAAGWSDADLPLLRDTLRYMQHTLHYDPQRVLLSGHSAGGALALHLLYAEDFPASAVAVAGAYLPPTVTAKAVEARRRVPVLCTLGETDPNRTAMLRGVNTLRQAGVDVKTIEFPAGHELTPAIGKAIMSWFDDICGQTIERRLRSARASFAWQPGHGERLADVEDVLRHADVYRPDEVREAREALVRLERPAREAFLEADRMVAEKRPFDARRSLLELEEQYQPASIVDEIHDKRLQIESDPRVARLLRLEPKPPAEWTASHLLHRAQWAVDRNRLADAIDICRKIGADYADTKAATAAKELLNSLMPDESTASREGSEP
jgi:acetyl esterase/lipase